MDPVVQAIKDVTSIKETTKAAYIADISTIKKYMDGIPMNEIISNPDTSYNKIINAAHDNRKSKNKPALSTQRTLLKTILACMKHTGYKEKNKDVFNKWYKFFMKLTGDLEDHQDNNVQSDSSMKWSEIIAKLTDEHTLDNVALALYTLIPPRRQQDYWKLRIGSEYIEGDTGVLDMENKVIKVMVFKTNTKYNTWEKIIPDRLYNILKGHLDDRGVKSPYLFCQVKSGKPYLSLWSFTNANNKVIKRVLGNPLASVNTIRHAGATAINMNTQLTRREKKDYAYDMGHSFNMQAMYVEVDRLDD